MKTVVWMVAASVVSAMAATLLLEERAGRAVRRAGMKRAAVEEVRLVSRKARDPGGVLPLALGGEACPFPAGVGVGLVEAHVADRRVGLDGGHAVEREGVPGAFALLPIERRAPALRGDGVPSGRKPQLGALVAAAALVAWM